MDLNSMRVLKRREKDHRKVEVRAVVVAVASMTAKVAQAKERKKLRKGWVSQTDF